MDFEQIAFPPAVIGGVPGIGLVKGVNTVSLKTLQGIFMAWFLTPVVACFFSPAINFIPHLKYIPPQ